MPVGGGVLVGKPALSAGQRDRLVLIEHLTESAGGSSFPVEGWSSLASEYMSRRELSAGERFASNQESAFAESQWHMTYRPDMDPEIIDVPKKRRLAYLGRTYDIVSASQIGNKDGIELLTLAGSFIA